MHLYHHHDQDGAGVSLVSDADCGASVTCPAIDVAASASMAGASCAGGAASGSPACAFTCSTGYEMTGASSIACGSDGESWEGGGGREGEWCLARA